jgi:Protein of unknown function (DUF2795)
MTLMGEPIQGSDQHSPRLDEELARDPSTEDENPDKSLWDEPGHDGVVGDTETDRDRTDLRAEIGTYIADVPFPASSDDLIRAATEADAPARVIDRLSNLEPDARFATTAELWVGLDLGTGHRF